MAGLDLALWDLALRAAGLTPQECFGFASHQQKCYASSINESDIEQLIPLHSSYGQLVFKVKVGLDAKRDRNFVRHTLDIAPPKSHVAIDANQSWSAEGASSFLQSLDDMPLEFVEEPIRADAPLSEWEALAQASVYKLAAGENVYGVAAFLKLADAGFSILQPDVTKWGGLTGALRLLEHVPPGVQIWPHFMGTGVGQMAALCLAAIADTGSLCELDVNSNPLRTALCAETFLPERDTISLTRCHGLVLPPLAGPLRAFSIA